MTSLQELCENYEKMMNNLKNIGENDTLTKKLDLIKRMIIDTNIAIENLNYDILTKKVNLTEQDQKDYNDMVIANNTLDMLAPYAIYLNLYQSLQKKSME